MGGFSHCETLELMLPCDFDVCEEIGEFAMGVRARCECPFLKQTMNPLRTARPAKKQLRFTLKGHKALSTYIQIRVPTHHHIFEILLETPVSRRVCEHLRWWRTFSEMLNVLLCCPPIQKATSTTTWGRELLVTHRWRKWSLSAWGLP